MSIAIAHAVGVADAHATADPEPASESDCATDAHANTAADAHREPDSEEDVRGDTTGYGRSCRRAKTTYAGRYASLRMHHGYQAVH